MTNNNLRGGGWCNTISMFLQLAFNNSLVSSFNSQDIGFRPVLGLSDHVLRGSGWEDVVPAYLRGGSRFGLSPVFRDFSLGFRLGLCIKGVK